jgi:hypothetical protein
LGNFPKKNINPLQKKKKKKKKRYFKSCFLIGGRTINIFILVRKSNPITSGEFTI